LHADSAGHTKRFRDFSALEALYERLPERFDAEAVGDVAGSDGRAGSPSLSGSRRHLVLRHFVEHPAFHCELVSRQPLTVQKTGTESRGSTSSKAAEEPPTEQEVTPMD